MGVHDDCDEGLSLPIVLLAQNSGRSMDILDHLIYLHNISMDCEKPLNTILHPVWLFETLGPEHSSNPDHGNWVAFYKEHNEQVEEAFALGITSIVELQSPHPDGKLFVHVREPLVSFIKKPNGHDVSLHKIMRALLPEDFQLMPIPGDGSEKKDTESSG